MSKIKRKNFIGILIFLVIIYSLLDIQIGPGYQKDKSNNINYKSTSGNAVFLNSLQPISGTLLIGPDNSIYNKYKTFLHSTKQFLKLQTYDFTNPFFKSEFLTLGKNIPIQIILEDNKYQQYQNTFKQIQDYFSGIDNIQVQSDKNMGTDYVHSKITLNENAFWIQTANLTKSSFESNREHFFYSEDKAIHDNLNQIFDYDWEGKNLHELKLHPNLVVCPINCRETIKQLLENAQSSIIIQTQYIVDNEILDILRKKSETINMAIIVADTDDNQNLISYFGPGIARTLKSNYNHTKMILIDEKYLLVGSMNLSENSLDKNREIGIILTDDTNIFTFLSGFKSDRFNSLP